MLIDSHTLKSESLRKQVNTVTVITSAFLHSCGLLENQTTFVKKGTFHRTSKDVDIQPYSKCLNNELRCMANFMLVEVCITYRDC